MRDVDLPGRRAHPLLAPVALAALALVGLGLPASATAQAADRAERPAIDGRIREADLQHDSRDDLYRSPVGAVPAGTTVLVRMRAAANDLSAARLRVTDRLAGKSVALPMERVATDPDGGAFGYEYWQVRLPTPESPTILDYTLVALDGQASRHLSDDRALDGGTGRISREAPRDRGWQITAYDPAFRTPEWAPGSVVYQIFPDRFANGDPTNDPSPHAVPDADGAGRFRHGDVYGNPVLQKAWGERPEGYCRAYQGVTCDEGPLGRDFFGGDLAGISAHLDDLADLGVTVIYLNPIFAAPSNHRYDTSMYSVVDPDLGSLAEFESLVAEARQRGIRIVLDGVFNHVSSDSPWFDRMRRYPELGACESADSPYREWFTFRRPGPAEPSPCAPSAKDGDDTYYVGWFGFDTIPELREVEAVDELVNGPAGVARTWLERGIAGWRLDVSDSMSHEFQASIREAARSVDPDAIVIAEQWGDSTPWLLGDQADSTMNYRFRRAVIGLVNGATSDPDGSIEAIGPNAFARAMLSVRDDYPEPAWRVLLNLVDSHDTARILWTLTPGPDDDASKSDHEALAIGRQSLRLVAAIQLTFPGMPLIYYGDEVGLSGHDDPDDRRPYPWGEEDLELRSFYRTLATLRAERPALRDGDLEFVHAEDAARTLAFLRRSSADAALTALNLDARPRVLGLDLAGLLPEGALLTDVLGGPGGVVEAGRLLLPLEPRTAAVLVTSTGIDLRPPEAPTGLQVVDAAPGAVELAWEPVTDATAYQVWRSPVQGGGYVSLGETSATTFTDETARDGVASYYVVTGRDGPGNRSPRSAEVSAVPRLTILEARLEGIRPAASGADLIPGLDIAISAVDGVVEASASIIADAPGERTAAGLVVEFGIGPAGTDPRDAAAWHWESATDARPDGVAARFRGLLLPEAVARHAVAARASSDGGTSWAYLDLIGHGAAFDVGRLVRLEVLPSDDTVAPPAPGTPELVDVAQDRVRLRWEPPGAPDVHRYVVFRGPSAEGPFEPVGITQVPIFTDLSVTAGAAYGYRVVAQDTSFNASAPGEALVVDAAERFVEVTFRVIVPPYTTLGDSVFIAGDFQGWDPGGTPMTRVDDVTWAISLPFRDERPLQYKYTRGSWEAVEKDAGCGEIPNRTLLVSYGSDGRQEVRDEVGRWRDLDACG